MAAHSTHYTVSVREIVYAARYGRLRLGGYLASWVDHREFHFAYVFTRGLGGGDVSAVGEGDGGAGGRVGADGIGARISMCYFGKSRRDGGIGAKSSVYGRSISAGGDLV